MQHNFENKTVVITGASSGLGLAAAQLFARSGARLELLDIAGAALQRVADKLQADGATVNIHVADITDTAAVSAAFTAMSGCDILINSAGIEGPAGALEDCDPTAYDKVMAVNVRGSLLCAQQAVKRMKQTGNGGAIVNVASTAGLIGSRRLGIYALSKAGVISMTRSLALSLAKDNIRVNAVCPGSIDSEMFDRTLQSADQAAERAAMIALHPLGRLGTPDEVAQAIAFLASTASAYTTGVCLPVDGGRLA
ncbi:SDR family NAD(P)-dependent oxidoreductase [Pseudochrobactrum sp. MP213Fo]|uniref:SDR family NAD(P)-dependent oxidoreductase n=1 Tax=Pseudochrobactrum sp. MP213Fo TaxID=3022250 RepID=UPI003BA078D8